MKPDQLIKTARALFYLNAVIWLILGITSLIQIEPDSTVPDVVLWIIALLMFGNAGAMFLSGIGIQRKNRWYYYFAILVLIVNIILTLTDQFGILDLITLVIDLFLFGILILKSKTILQSA